MLLLLDSMTIRSGLQRSWPRSLGSSLFRDGTLHLLPFEALVHDKKYLIATRTVSVAPSATVLGILRNGERSSAGQLPYLGIAPWG